MRSQGCVLAIWTRDRNASAATGRGRLASAIREVMGQSFPSVHCQLLHALDPRTALGLARLWLELVWQLALGRLMPLQCLLYLPQQQSRHIVRAAGAADVTTIYLDGIRAAAVIPHLRRLFPTAKIVLDMDDLMSRRWRSWQRAGIGLTLGFLERYLPSRLLESERLHALGRAAVRYEIWALRQLEITLAAEADLVVLNSPREAALYRRLVRRSGRPVPQVIAIAPPARPGASIDWASHDLLRFAFIGTDQIPQNWLTIDYLIAYWQRLRPATELFLFGQLGRCYPVIRNVRCVGYVNDLALVYLPGTILVSPSFVHGGIKTKVIEAFAHGCPVLGNHATFEGIPLPQGYPMQLAMTSLEAVLAQPERYRSALAEAALMGRDLAHREFGLSQFRNRWERALAPAALGPAVAPRPLGQQGPGLPPVNAVAGPRPG